MSKDTFIEDMSVGTMRNCIQRYLDKSDSMVRTLYEVLFLESMGHKVEIRVRESDFVKGCRAKRKLDLVEKKKEQSKRIHDLVEGVMKDRS